MTQEGGTQPIRVIIGETSVVGIQPSHGELTRVLSLGLMGGSGRIIQSVGTKSATKDITWRDVSSGRGKEAQRMLMMSTSER